ncbi:MAG: hypothetical protein NT084_03390 [Bacteroidetes bacterium]|nr:hypothetical protein [Bacteroidota bacterium]
MKNSSNIFQWVPRILGILAILFISLFAADSFSPNLTLSQQLLGFLIHLIPSFVLLGVLILAWKRELIGGIVFCVIGIVMSPFVFSLNYKMNHSIWISVGIILLITFPFIVLGFLFILSYMKNKKKRNLDLK